MHHTQTLGFVCCWVQRKIKNALPEQKHKGLLFCAIKIQILARLKVMDGDTSSYTAVSLVVLNTYP